MTTLTSAIGTSRSALSAQIAELWSALRLFGLRGWIIAAAAGGGTLLVIGGLADIIENPIFTRMVSVRTQDYIILAVTAVLAGLIAGTFALPTPGNEGKALLGGLLSELAVGCPICNKLALVLLGTSGALTFFAPAQLYIGLASLALLGWTLRLRARAVAGPCPVPAPADRLEERPSITEVTDPW